LLRRIRLVVAPDITTRYPAEWGTRLTFTLRDGSVRSLSAAFPRGNPENPVATGTLEEKFRTLVAPRYNPELAEQAIAAVRRLPEERDMAGVFAEF
jgi:2-methylcitrate dehydratase PrpD